jgi:hypothetical protein
MEHTLEPIFGAGLQTDLPAAMGEQRAQVTDVGRRHPNLEDHVGAQQLR